MFSLLIADLRKRGARSLLLLLGAVIVSAAFGLLAFAVSNVVSCFWKVSGTDSPLQFS